MTEPTMTTNNESVSEEEVIAFVKERLSKLMENKQGELCMQILDLEKETKTLREQVEELQNRDGNWMDKFGACKVCDGEIPHGHTENCDLYKKEQHFNQLTLKLEQVQAENVRLQERVEIMRETIEIIGSQNHNLECPKCSVCEAVDRALSSTPTTEREERYRRMEAVESAATALVTRMKEIYNEPIYRYVWESAANHGIDYSNGLKWENEFIALEQALATESDKEKQ